MNITTALKKQPGATAAELGTTTLVMRDLEKQGKVVAVGTRRTGKRGKPPVEWAVPGPQADALKAQHDEATERVKQERKAAQKPAKAPQTASNDEDEITLVSAPPLPNIEDIHASLSDEHRPQVEYIERVFARGGREMADYNLLIKRYKDIARITRNQLRHRKERQEMQEAMNA